MKLQTRIALLVTFLTVSLGLITLFEASYLFSKHIRSTQNNWVTSISKVIAESIAETTINKDKLAVEQQLRKISSFEKSFSYIYVRDFDGKLFAHSFANGFPVKLVPHLYDEKSHLTNNHAIGNMPIDEISVPLIKGMEGKIYFGINQSEFHSFVSSARRDLFFTVLLITLIGISIAVLVGRKISQPLRTLSDKMKRFSVKGNVRPISANTNEPSITNLVSAFNEMVTARKQVKTALFESEEKLRTTFESIGDAVIATDTDGHITRMNPVAEQLTDWTLSDAIHKHLDEIFIIINAKTREPAINPVNTVIEHGKIVGLANHTILISKTGQEYQIADSAAPITDDGGEITGVVLVFRDVTEDYQIREALISSERQLSLHMENTPIGVINWDKNLTCTGWNPAAEQIFGISRTGAIGTQADHLITPKGTKLEKQGLVRRLKNPAQNRQFTMETVNHHDSPVVCEWFNTPITDEDGQFTGTASLVQNISYRIEIENELRNALVDAEQANQAKSEFLATMSHEFRTPLNAILGFSDMLKQQYFGPLGAENYKDYANDIHNSGKHMLELVNDVLDISAIEAGTRELEKSEMDAAHIVHDCVHNLIQFAKNKNITITTDIPKPIPVMQADKRSIVQVLLNLLSNAIKFTEQGGHVTVTATSQGNTLKFTVTDTGIGIPVDRIDAVTEPFIQLDANPHIAQEGTGLGLSIVKSLTETHGGKIIIKSKPGEGTAVTVTFVCDPV